MRLQGFSWLGIYISYQVFGAKTSVCNYDILGETSKTMVKTSLDHALFMAERLNAHLTIFDIKLFDHYPCQPLSI